MIHRSFKARIGLVAFAACSTISACSGCGDDETEPTVASSSTTTTTGTTSASGTGGAGGAPLCYLPAFEPGDAVGHADPYGAKAAKQARAGVLTTDAIVQPAHGRQKIEPGDYVLANDRIAVVIEKPGLSDGYARFGGEILAVDQVGDDGRPKGLSKYGETLLGIAIEMIEPTSVTVLKDGSDGGEAVVRAAGKLKPIPFLGEGVFAAFFPNPYGFTAAIDYVLKPGSDALLLRFGVNNPTQTEINFGVDRLDSEELYGFFHTSQMQIVTPEKGFATPGSTAGYVGFGGGGFGFAFRDLDKPLRFGISQSGFNLFYGNGHYAPACAQTMVDHVEIIAGGPDYDGLRAAIRRHSGEAEQRLVTGVLKDAEGAPIANASVHELAEDGAYLSRVHTGPDGAFAIHAPAAPVKLVPHLKGYPPHQGATLAADATKLDLAFAPHAKLHVTVKDSVAGEPVPVRVQVLPKTKIASTPEAFGKPDETNGRLHQDFAVTGESTLVVPPGEHRVLVSRGYEWEIFDATVTAAAGETTEVPVTLMRSVDSTGVMCADFHIHSFMSMDSSDPIDFKVKGALADGLEIPVSSEHEWVVDFQPVIEKLGMQKWAFGVPSEELTTFKYGHFGIVPLTPKYDQLNAGALEWIGRPVGEVFADAHAQKEGSVVVVNHPRGGSLGAYFSASAFDHTKGEGRNELWSPDFDFLEVFNDSDFEENRKASVRDWFSILNNKGRKLFAVGSSDSHSLRTSPVGYPRTCFAFGHDDPTKLTYGALTDAMKGGNSTISGGLMMTVAGPKDAHPGSSVAGVGATPKFTVTLQAASFVDATSIEVIVNGETVATEAVLPMGDGPGHKWVNEIDVPLPAGKESWVIFHAKGEGDLAPLHPNRKPFAVSNPVFLTP